MAESRVGIVGPGRVGGAFGRRVVMAGLPLVACVGRDQTRARAAFDFMNGATESPSSQRPSDPMVGSALASADIVLLTVGDAELPLVVATAAQRGWVGVGSLWLHTSGLHDRAMLEALRRCGARTAVLHPLCAIPDPTSGVRMLDGALASIDAAPADVAAVRAFAERVGLRVLVLTAVADRRVYHAACTLAANGASALHDIVAELFVSQGMDAADARLAAADLAHRSIGLCATLGARDALSGPVARGDTAAVTAHLAALAAAQVADASAVYTALSMRAVELTRRRGRLQDAQLAALRRALRGGEAPD